MFDKKRGSQVTQILGGPPQNDSPAGGGEGKPGAQEEAPVGHIIMSEFIDAVHNKDHEAAWDAFQAGHHEMNLGKEEG